MASQWVLSTKTESADQLHELDSSNRSLILFFISSFSHPLSAVSILLFNIKQIQLVCVQTLPCHMPKCHYGSIIISTKLGEDRAERAAEVEGECSGQTSEHNRTHKYFPFLSIVYILVHVSVTMTTWLVCASHMCFDWEQLLSNSLRVHPPTHTAVHVCSQ